MSRRNKRASDNQVWRRKESRYDKWAKRSQPAKPLTKAGKPGEPALSSKLSNGGIR